MDPQQETNAKWPFLNRYKWGRRKDPEIESLKIHTKTVQKYSLQETRERR